MLYFLKKKEVVGSRRVVGRKLVKKTPGYIDHDLVFLNVLQEYKARFGLVFARWVDVDQEEVPSWALISYGAFGDFSGWISKFKNMPNVTFYDKSKA